jgi:O-antigen/teichoic acid export membrane protein
MGIIAQPLRRARREFRSLRALLAEDLGWYGLGAMADQASRMLVGLAAAAVLTPVTFGSWVLANSMIQYASFASFGAVHGAAREIPRLLGEGDAARAAHVEAVARGLAISAGVGAAAVAMVAGLLVLWDIEAWLLGVAVFVQGVGFFQQAVFRGRLQFRAAGEQLLVGAVVLPMLAVPGFGAGANGLVAARAAAGTVALWITARRRSAPWRLASSLTTTRTLVRVGAPIMLGGVIVAVLLTLDRWLIEALMGRSAVGVYGIVIMTANALLVVPTFLAQQVYPRLSYRRGAGATARDLLREAFRFGAVAAVVTATLGSAVAVLAALLVPQFLPAYAVAIPALQLMVVAVVTYAAGAGLAYVLNLTDHQVWLLVSQAVAVAVNLAVSLMLVRVGFGLNAFPLALLLAFATSGLLTLGAATWVAHHEERSADRVPGAPR